MAICDRDSGSGRGQFRQESRRELCGFGQDRKLKQDAEQQPKVGVHNEILIRLHAGESHGEKQQERIPKNAKSYGEKWRAPELYDDTPCADQCSRSHNEPEKQSDNAHFKHDCAVATFNTHSQRSDMEYSRNILCASTGCPYAVTIRPAREIKGSQEIPKGIVPGSGGKFAVRPAGRKRFIVETQTRGEGFWKYLQKHDKAQYHACGGSDECPEHGPEFPVTPPRAPQRGEYTHNDAPRAPKQSTARGGE